MRHDPDRHANTDRIIDDVERLRDGRLDRGQFLRRSVALGLSLPTAGMILSACGAGTEAGGSSSTTAAANVPEKLTGPLTFTNWASFIDPKQVPMFEKETKVKVKQSFFASNEDLLSKLRTANGAYDVALPGSNAVQILIATGGLEPLNRKWLPNAAPGAMLPRFQSTKTDPKSTYSVPNDWSFHGIGVRRDLVDEDVQSWADLWRLKDKYSGKITVMDDQRNTIGAALKLLGYSHNSTSKKEIDAAVDKLIELKPHLLAVTSSNQREMLLSGQAVMAMDWNQSAASAHEENANYGFVTPKDGTGYYVDFLVVPKGAKNPYTAHRFIDFLHSPAQYARFVTFTTTPWTQEGVAARLPSWMRKSTWLNPPASAALEYQVDVGDATTIYGDAWTRFKSA